MDPSIKQITQFIVLCCENVNCEHSTSFTIETRDRCEGYRWNERRMLLSEIENEETLQMQMLC